jgi:hypothetical protein
VSGCDVHDTSVSRRRWCKVLNPNSHLHRETWNPMNISSSTCSSSSPPCSDRGWRFPQARRIARTRRVDGVSAVWIGVSLAINGWWLTYGLVAGVWALVPVSVDLAAAVRRDGVGSRATVGWSALPDWRSGCSDSGWSRCRSWSPAAGTRRRGDRAVLRRPTAAGGRGALRTSRSVRRVVGDLDHRLRRSGTLVGLRPRGRRLALTLAGGVGVAMASVILARLAVTGHRPFVVLDPRRRLDLASTG